MSHEGHVFVVCGHVFKVCGHVFKFVTGCDGCGALRSGQKGAGRGAKCPERSWLVFAGLRGAGEVGRIL